MKKGAFGHLYIGKWQDPNTRQASFHTLGCLAWNLRHRLIFSSSPKSQRVIMMWTWSSSSSQSVWSQFEPDFLLGKNLKRTFALASQTVELACARPCRLTMMIYNLQLRYRGACCLIDLHNYDKEVYTGDNADDYDWRIQRILSFLLFLDLFGKGWREKFTH